jgi:hypothetical protein
MFNKPFDERLQEWRQFRQHLNQSKTPIKDTVDFYHTAPLVNFQADPYDQSTWPDPWQLLQENIYCPFVKILAICYTLQLTDSFSQTPAEIHIIHNKKSSSINYLLDIGNCVVEFNGDSHVVRSELPKNLDSQQSYTMSPLQ